MDSVTPDQFVGYILDAFGGLGPALLSVAGGAVASIVLVKWGLPLALDMFIRSSR